MTDENASHQETLGNLVAENDLTLDSRFYRYTMPEHLKPGDDAGTHRLSANTEPSEAVIDVYAQGHMILAEQVGQGWRSPDAGVQPGRVGPESAHPVSQM